MDDPDYDPAWKGCARLLLWVVAFPLFILWSWLARNVPSNKDDGV